MAEAFSPKQAVILSGGGALGAYEVGVLKALLSGRSPATGGKPLDPDIFTGTSVGSFNAAYLASQWDQLGSSSISNLERVWCDKMSQQAERGGNGAYRFIGNPLELADPRYFINGPLRYMTRLAGDSIVLLRESTNRLLHALAPSEEIAEGRFLYLVNIDNLISREPFSRLLKEEIPFDHIGASSRQLRVIATSWETGRVDTFSNSHFTEKLGPQIIMASSAIPGFFSPSPIGAQLFVDGGVLENTPLNPAIDAGADALHVIYLDPDVDKIPIQYLSNLLSVMYRVLVINWADKINQSVRLARLINEIITRLSGDPNVTEVAEAFKKHLGLKTSLRRLIIHLYHPRHELGGPFSLLDFRHETIDGLIEAGFNDAARHNCANNGCLVE